MVIVGEALKLGLSVGLGLEEADFVTLGVALKVALGLPLGVAVGDGLVV